MSKSIERNLYNAIVARLSRELFRLCKELAQEPKNKELIWKIYEEFKEWLNTKVKYIN